MNFSLDVIKTNSLFFIGFFLYIFLGLAATEYYGRDELQILLNSYHNTFFDYFFKWISSYGVILILILAVVITVKKYNYKTLLFLASAYGTAMILTLLIKNIFFDEVSRPTLYFQQKGIELYKIPGVLDQAVYTFPSGHSVDGFLMMLFFSCLTNNKLLEWMCLFYAVLLAYSRIYLSKHFVIDTCGGAVLGVAIYLLFYYIFQSVHNIKLLKKITR